MSDIRRTLELVRDRLDEFLSSDDPRPEGVVALASAADPDGKVYEGATNMLVMSLANVQREITVSTYNRTTPVADNKYAVLAPPLYVDLFVLFYANFHGRRYSEGLGLLSRTISFFQQNPWFTHRNLPGLPRVVDKLTFELTNLELTDLNHLLGMLGLKYLPSVYYKVRLLPFASEAILATVPAARGLQAPSDPADAERPL
jgi:hypothetical protein